MRQWKEDLEMTGNKIFAIIEIFTTILENILVQISNQETRKVKHSDQRHSYFLTNARVELGLP